MKVEAKFGVLKASDKEQVGESLQAVLYDLLALALVLKQAHWNVVGSEFRSVHLQLDEIVETVRNYSDEVAERCVAVGVPALGQAVEISKCTKLSPIPEGFLRDQQVIDLIAERIERTVNTTREHIETLDEPDPVSQDLLIEISTALEKHLWMLRAQQA